MEDIQMARTHGVVFCVLSLSLIATMESVGATRDYFDPPCIGTSCCTKDEGTNSLVWNCFYAYPICFQSVVIGVTCWDHETGAPFRVEFNFSKRIVGRVLTCINFNASVRGMVGCTWGDRDPCSAVCSIEGGLDFVDAFCVNYRQSGCSCEAIKGPACLLLNRLPNFPET